jgi:hypothetical protein
VLVFTLICRVWTQIELLHRLSDAAGTESRKSAFVVTISINEAPWTVIRFATVTSSLLINGARHLNIRFL